MISSEPCSNDRITSSAAAEVAAVATLTRQVVTRWTYAIGVAISEMSRLFIAPARRPLTCVLPRPLAQAAFAKALAFHANIGIIYILSKATTVINHHTSRGMSHSSERLRVMRSLDVLASTCCSSSVQ